VNYDRWCRSREYRRSLADQLELPFTDAGFEDVTGFGGGSSFEGTEFDGQASAMHTDRRWVEFRNDPEFQALFRDPQLIELGLSIFGADGELKHFVESKLQPRATRAAAADRKLRAHLLEPLVMRIRRFRAARYLHQRLLARRKRRRLPLPSSPRRLAVTAS